jgi:hypothetical protein
VVTMSKSSFHPEHAGFRVETRKKLPGQTPKLGDLLAEALAKAHHERLQSEEFWHEVWGLNEG